MGVAKLALAQTVLIDNQTVNVPPDPNISAPGGLTIGNTGLATLNVNAGGTVSNGFLNVGQNSTSTGTLDINTGGIVTSTLSRLPTSRAQSGP